MSILCQNSGIGDLFIKMDNEYSLIEIFCNELKTMNNKSSLLFCILSSIENLLLIGENMKEDENCKQNIFMVKIMKLNGEKMFEILQNHDDEKIYKKAQVLMSNYFDCE